MKASLSGNKGEALGVRAMLAAVLGFLLAVSLSLLNLSACLWVLGTNEALMTRWMLRCAPPAATTLPQDAYAPVCRLITGYLRGDAPEFQYRLTSAAGDEILLFHDYEQAHMADCRELFRLDRRVLWGAALLSVLLLAALWALRQRRSALRGLLCGGLAWIGLVLAVLVWGLCDFGGLFVSFHRLAFTNDLWLLNPAIDLLVRLMPTSLFVRYATVLALVWGGGLLALCAAAGWLLRRETAKERKKRPNDL